MIAVYGEGSAMERLLRSCTRCRPHVWAESRTGLARALARTGTAVVALPELGADDAEWLRAAVVPPWQCAVVTPLSLESLQRLRMLDRCRFRAAWAEEAAGRLPAVLDEFATRGADPLRLLGEEMVRRGGLRPLLAEAVSHICNLSIDLSPPPPPPPKISRRRRWCAGRGRRPAGGRAAALTDRQRSP